MFALKTVFTKSPPFYLSNQRSAFNKTLGIPQELPTVVNQSVRAFYGELCDSSRNLVTIYRKILHSDWLQYSIYLGPVPQNPISATPGLNF